MKKALLTISILSLSACASPAVDMTPEQVSHLSDDQLCNLQSSYSWEEKTEIEIGKRNLNCDPIHRECLSQGFKPETPELNFCINQIKQQQALQKQIAAQQDQIRYEQEQRERQKTIYDYYRR